jgi:hypothetical protein
MKYSIRGLALLGTVLVLSACGGGGGESDTQSSPTGGISRTGIASGPIATFGSIVVNGVHYNTDAASFRIDGNIGQQSDLSVGQIVTVQGTIDSNGTTGTANTVIFDDIVKGPVQSIDLIAQEITVLGQTVAIVAETSFDDRFSPASIDGLSLNQIVSVSGQIDSNGHIVASRLEPKPAGTKFKVHGNISNFDSSTLRFNINALVVDFSAAILDNFSGGQPADGDFVEVKGTALDAANELLATKVELESRFPGGTNGAYAEIEGFITRFDSAQDFDVGGMPVSTSASTVFTGGDPSDLGLNLKVEVEGVIDSNDVLVAQKVKIRRAKVVRVTADIDSVDTATNSVVVLGITVNVDTLTRLEDKSNADVDPMNLSDLNAGDYVEIRGSEIPAGSGVILAARFEREDADNDAILRGFVETFNEPGLSILGVVIETNGNTVFRDLNNTRISSAEFFAQLAPNTLVKAKGTEVSDSTIVARELELEMEQ